MTVEVITDQIPTRQPNQDEGLILIALRRVDPGNPDGSPTPDIGNALSTPDPDFVNALAAYVQGKGFDLSESYVTVAGVTDVEQGGAVSISVLKDLVTPSE